MQQHDTLGEITKPTNCAKFLMIEQPTIYHFHSPKFHQHGYTKREQAVSI